MIPPRYDVLKTLINQPTLREFVLKDRVTSIFGAAPGTVYFPPQERPDDAKGIVLTLSLYTLAAGNVQVFLEYPNPPIMLPVTGEPQDATSRQEWIPIGLAPTGFSTVGGTARYWFAPAPGTQVDAQQYVSTWLPRFWRARMVVNTATSVEWKLTAAYLY